MEVITTGPISNGLNAPELAEKVCKLTIKNAVFWVSNGCMYTHVFVRVEKKYFLG